ncbi:hypothetical protein ACIGFK_29645 [Streptomyces sp. NPDC085524]|uniref:hypothetical protein n=1 Tax=unclassified Streptomyces TaxID=2593676 RepID=UPI0035D8163F
MAPGSPGSPNGCSRPELDTVTRAYVATGIHREWPKVSVPFPAAIDLGRLVP